MRDKQKLNVINQIQGLLAYRKGDTIYKPSYFVEGTNKSEINDFFERCIT